MAGGPNALIALAPAFGIVGGVSIRQREEWAEAVLRPVLNYQGQADIARVLAEALYHIAVLGPRRSGKSMLARVVLALMLIHDGYVVRMLTSVLRAPSANILDRAQDRGVVGWLTELGLVPGIASVHRHGRSVMSITFPWNSGLYVHDINNEQAVAKHHGITASLYWVDEATKMRPGILSYALRSLVYPTLADYGARIMLTYTPDDDPDSLPSRLQSGNDGAWKSCTLASWRNPHFGEAFGERWATVLRRSVETARTDYALQDSDLARLHGLSETECDAVMAGDESDELRLWIDGDGTPENPGLDSELLKNLFGRSVRNAAAHVYVWHRVPPLQLYWAATGTAHDRDNALPVAATLEDRLALLTSHPDESLRHPDPARSLEWQIVVSVDIGYRPDPWAITVWAWSWLHPAALELYSDARHEMGDAEMLREMVSVTDRLFGAGWQVDVIVADLTGMRTGTRVDWDRAVRARFPTAAGGDALRVVAPKKGPKLARRRIANIDLWDGRIRVLAGSTLDVEGRNLRFKADRPGEVDKQREIPLPGGRSLIPGNHCLDTMLYGGDEIKALRAERPDPTAHMQDIPNQRHRAFMTEQLQ